VKTFVEALVIASFVTLLVGHFVNYNYDWISGALIGVLTGVVATAMKGIRIKDDEHQWCRPPTRKEDE
jgi:hypothetical protein